MKNILDLHGQTLHSAWKSVDNFINECYYNNNKSCIIVCGQGAIKQEIESWLYLHSKVREFKLNPRTQGSYNIKLNKRKSK